MILTPNSSGRYPLHVAVCAGSCEGTELLLCFGASVNAMDEQGHTALDCAEALHCAAGETIKGMLKKRGAERHHIRGSDDDLTLSGISGGGTPPQGLSFASCQWNDFGLTSHTRDADMSEPLEMPSMHSGLDTSITDEGDIDEVITLPPPTTPPANPEPVFFVDPNSRNTLEFSVERGELSYTVKVWQGTSIILPKRRSDDDAKMTSILSVGSKLTPFSEVHSADFQRFFPLKFVFLPYRTHDGRRSKK